jgi:hypothetical protein
MAHRERGGIRVVKLAPTRNIGDFFGAFLIAVFARLMAPLASS